ncbi:uncharacterized protein LOC124387662 isoform X2 [Silurus meridionalis]|uniref:uncharacterized protein LOC124387662 isoform X2 n=1 Tax=Silurus meridionalis TaxID=175797 RepID=UPI001EEC1D60|nr:uncharacterized protein LOC124387662 isoform X2 [Silurus meridionalis]
MQALERQKRPIPRLHRDMESVMEEHFKDLTEEKEELLLHYVEEMSLAKDVELENLPVTPCVIVCGRFCYAAVRSVWTARL